jgi:hypothetical protein
MTVRWRNQIDMLSAPPADQKKHREPIYWGRTIGGMLNIALAIAWAFGIAGSSETEPHVPLLMQLSLPIQLAASGILLVITGILPIWRSKT